MSIHYYGVTAARAKGHEGHWQVQIRAGAKILTWPRRFADQVEAARLADALALCVRGPDARLNFDGVCPPWVTPEILRAFFEDRGALESAPWIKNYPPDGEIPLAEPAGGD